MDINDIIKPENKVYGKSSVLTDNIMHYCPGCSHGVVHKLVAQVIEEMDIQDKTIGVSPVGCSVFAYNYLVSELDKVVNEMEAKTLEFMDLIQK